MAKTMVGVIGGSGLYDLPGLEDARWETVEGPWGPPSDALHLGRLGGIEVAFLPRHGRGHRLSPSEINYRANIDALKRVGVTDLISVSAVGSLKEELAPGTFVLVDQFIDRTYARAKTFFFGGCVAHVGFADPVSPGLVDRLEAAARAEAVAHVRGGTYVVMEGPQFSTRAESELHRGWGASVIGMTAMPEAKLAREAELCYASVAMVTDYDCWHAAHGDVDVPSVLRVMAENRAKAQALIARVIRDMPAEHPPCSIGSDRALDHAIMTAPEAIDPDAAARLAVVAGRVLAGLAPGARAG